MNIDNLANNLRDTNFTRDLLDRFIERGLGSLPGRETTIALVDLLLQHHPDWRDTPPAEYEIARLLRTSPRKIRNILDELSYRDHTKTDDWCRDRLREILLNSEAVDDQTYLTVQIDDGLVRDFATKTVRKLNGVIEHGFNSSLVRLTPKMFLTLAVEVLDQSDLQLFKTELTQHGLLRGQSPDYDDIKRIFLKSLAEGAGKEAGTKIVGIGFGLLTGGISEAISFATTPGNTGAK